jgi:predicted MFS family arabinose efflux permease
MEPGAKVERHRSGYGRLLKDVSLTALWGAALYSTYTYLGTGLANVSHATPAGISMGVAAFGVGMVGGGLTGGHMADRWGSARVTAASCAAMAVALITLRAAMPFFWRTLPALFLFSFSSSLFFPAFQTFLARHHAARRGAALAWNNSALYTGITVGSFLGGHVLARWGFRAVPFLSVGFAAIALVWGKSVQRAR